MDWILGWIAKLLGGITGIDASIILAFLKMLIDQFGGIKAAQDWMSDTVEAAKQKPARVRHRLSHVVQ